MLATHLWTRIMTTDLSTEAKYARCRTALGKVLLHNQDITDALKHLIAMVELCAPEKDELKPAVAAAKIAIGVDPTGRGVMI